jgi:uncharacterized membrane protein
MRLQRYLVSGILTVVPLWVTYLIFEFIFERLSNVGMPWIRALAGQIRSDSPNLAQWLLDSSFQSTLAALITLVGLYLLGWSVNHVMGKRIVGGFEALLNRMPGIKGVYGAVKKLVNVFEHRPENGQRVVLIAFPTPEMKTVGLVTRTLIDTQTGKELSAVFVPTTPNPTSGYLEIIPSERLTPTDWTLEQAMSFIVSGGAVAPDGVSYDGPKAPQRSEPPPA